MYINLLSHRNYLSLIAASLSFSVDLSSGQAILVLSEFPSIAEPGEVPDLGSARELGSWLDGGGGAASDSEADDDVEVEFRRRFFLFVPDLLR